MLKAAKAYLSTQVNTSSQGDVLLMLYDTAIKHLKLAKVKIAERDYAGKGVLITKAIEIVSELHECLNKEKGGEVSKNLSQVYFFCNTRMLQANLEMNPAKLDEVVGVLSGLRQAFAQIISGQDGAAPAAPFAAPASPALPSQPAPASPERQAAPEAEPAQEAKAPEAPEAPAAQPAQEPQQPVSTMRFRAASAYANAR